MDYTEQDFSETAGGEFKNTLDIGKSPGSSSQGFCFILVQKKKKWVWFLFAFRKSLNSAFKGASTNDVTSKGGRGVRQKVTLVYNPM